MARQDRRTVAVLLELTKTLIGGVPLDIALQAVTETALKLLPAGHASIHVFDEGRERLLDGARAGLSASREDAASGGADVFINRVAEHGKVVRIRDVAADPRFPSASDLDGVASLLAVPMSSSGQIMGVLAVTSARAGAFDQEHELLAMLLANCAVPAIDRARLERLAATDPDTGAFNRRYLFPRLRQEIRRARRYSLPLSLLVMVLESPAPGATGGRDDEDSSSDPHGETLGDLADLIRSSVRVTDVLVRRQRHELLLIMPHTSESQAFTVAQRIRAGVARAAEGEDPAPLADHTISLSVAPWNGQEGAKELELRADRGVAEAMRRGGNRVVLAQALEDISDG